MPGDTIEIALQSDRRFFPGLLVTACSMAQHASKDATIRFNILDGGLGEDNRGKLTRCIEKLHPHIILNWISFDQNCLSNLPEWRGCGKMTWARVSLPQLLPTADWVIYYDVDFLCLGDVSDLWALKNDIVALMSVPDYWPLTVSSEKSWFKKNASTYKEHLYFCAGFCFFNLKRIRAENLVQKFNQIIQANTFFPCVDQSVLNLAFADRSDIKMLPKCWQRYTRDLVEEDFVSPPMIHFAGEAPWVCFRINRIFDDASLFWFRYYSKLIGVNTWAALREFYKPHEIILYRITYLVFSRIGLMRKALHAYFRKIGHESSIIIYDALLHRVKYPAISYAISGKFEDCGKSDKNRKIQPSQPTLRPTARAEFVV